VPNIKSASKRVLIAKKNNARNKAAKSNMKTNLKKFESAVSGGDKTAAASAYKIAVKTVDRAASRGFIHKNNAAHKKSSLTSRLNNMQ
jgi:small subunit ribosomal protein S20